MAKQWKKSLEQSDILSDGQPFDGSNIDAPISSAGGITGDSTLLFDTIQSPFGTEVTGGNVDVNRSGVMLESGQADGDGAHLLSNNGLEIKKFKHKIIFYVAAVGGEIKIGQSDQFSDGIYMELTQGNIFDRTSNIGNISTVQQGDYVEAETSYDFVNNEATFSLSGSVNDSTTVTGIRDSTFLDKIVTVEGDGSNRSRLYCFYVETEVQI